MKLVLFLAGLAVVALGVVIGTWLIRQGKPPTSGDAEVQWFRIEALEEGSPPVPFFLGVPERGESAYLQNGEDMVTIEVRSREPYKFYVPVFGTNFELHEGDDDELEGTWVVPLKGGLKFSLRGHAIPEPSPAQRFPGDGAPAADLGGNWRVDIAELGTGRAVFRQDKAGNLQGSLIPPEIGDTRYLSGRVIGDRFQMSSFNGIQAFLVEGTISSDGQRLDGTWTVLGWNSLRISATRGNEPPVASLVTVHLKEGEDRITLAELDDLKGKPVIVDFFGTWCTSCMDLTPVLVNLKRKYGDQGLEILSIALEPEGDEEATATRVAEYREKYSIDWPISVRHVDEITKELPPELEGVVGFPVSVFVGRDGKVVAVHTSFVSDAARPEHREVLDRFDQWARAITAEASADEPAEKADAGTEEEDGD